MDKFIANLPHERIGELNICSRFGIAYQRDMRNSVPYDKAYFDKYAKYEITPIARRLHIARTQVVGEFCAGEKILDIGIGCGTFISRATNFDVLGYDINPAAITWLEKHKCYHAIEKGLDQFTGITCWDVLEHMREPGEILGKLKPGQYLFIAIPIFPDFENITQDKHYRPNEHYYYFTERGLLSWLRQYRLKHIKTTEREQWAGRYNIKTYVMRCEK